ncbi:putative lipid scramblase CLPTM1 [Tigriopus californicus]|uniref:putative lipid scramblase CLPTM1 n=1 Tax=Tigriopus californicus TaxID=6832 RepID=UPI0027DA6C7B|nr:putative lipid scramblase CLPTM1 [Tigriopus californicus]
MRNSVDDPVVGVPAPDDPSSLQIAPMAHQDPASPPGPPAGQAHAGDGAGVEPSAWAKVVSMAKSMVMRGLVIYFIMQFFRRPNAGAPPGAGTGVSGPSGAPLASPAAHNLFANGTVMDLYVYVSEDLEFGGFNQSGALVWLQKDLVYGDWGAGPQQDGVLTFDTTLPTTQALRNNGSLYMHAFIVRAGKSPDPSTGKGRFAKKWTLAKTKRLNKFKKKSYRKTANLITGQTDKSEEDQVKIAEGVKEEIISHWHPNITVSVVWDFTPWTPGQVPPPLDEFVEFTPSLQNYKPIMFVNDYWNLNRDYMPLNESVQSLNFSVTFQPLTMFKFQMYSAQQMRNRYNIMGNLMGDEEDDDQDSIKEAFLETNIYLLGLTFVVSLVHSVFEFLAFKNDIQFWNNRKSLEGLSVRSVFFNVFQSLIVLLYVLDNETNTIIKISCLVGLGIEIWKINKVFDVTLDRQNLLFGLFPRPVFKDKGSYAETGTKEYDRMAFKYLGILLFPLAFGYCVYSVIYNEHRGWYSFILNSIYGFLLTFGFIMMTPQLFINYKLKSVAHLPWRMMTYKALNTFIDDIFAFVIKMPTMYRLGCFRDDIVFFIFLYQKYIYRVDHSRLNEFGFSGDMLDEVNSKKEVGSSGEETKAVEDSRPEQVKSQDEKKKD